MKTMPVGVQIKSSSYPEDKVIGLQKLKNAVSTALKSIMLSNYIIGFNDSKLSFRNQYLSKIDGSCYFQNGIHKIVW